MCLALRNIAKILRCRKLSLYVKIAVGQQANGIFPTSFVEGPNGLTKGLCPAQPSTISGSLHTTPCEIVVVAQIESGLIGPEI